MGASQSEFETSLKQLDKELDQLRQHVKDDATPDDLQRASDQCAKLITDIEAGGKQIQLATGRAMTARDIDSMRRMMAIRGRLKEKTSKVRALCDTKLAELKDGAAGVVASKVPPGNVFCLSGITILKMLQNPDYVVYSCDKNSNTNEMFVRVQFVSPVFVPVYELAVAMQSEEYKKYAVLLFQPTGRILKTTQSYQNRSRYSITQVSVDHCQAGTQKRIHRVLLWKPPSVSAQVSL